MQRKKRLGDDSLDWIKDTKETSPKTSDSKKKVENKPKRAAKSVKLDVLKHYVSEEAEEKKIIPKKAPPPPIPKESATIVRGKKEVTPEKEKVREDIKEEVEEKEAAIPEKEEIKKIEVLEKKSMKVRSKKILLYQILRLKKTAKGVSDNFLSGIWLTGVTIGLVKKSASKIMKSMVGP